MKKHFIALKRTISAILTASLCMSLCLTLSPATVNAESTHIYSIVTNPAENCDTSMNIGWHADIGYENCRVLYTKATDTAWNNSLYASAVFDSDDYKVFYGRRSITAKGVVFDETPQFLNYSATLTSLTPDTDYMYKISDGAGGFSEVYRFKTSGADIYSFVWISDIHSYDPLPSRLTNGVNSIAYAASVAKYDVGYVFSTGDMLALGGSYSHWQTLYGKSFIKDYMFANIVGNHDLNDKRRDDDSTDPLALVTGEYYRVMHNNPKNGYTNASGENLIGRSYYFMYNDVLYIMFDYSGMIKTQADYDAGFAWAGGVIDKLKGQYKYLIVAEHVNFFYAATGLPRYYTKFKGFCDKYNVDIAVCGDEHIYSRTGSVFNDEKNSDSTRGTYYICAPLADGSRGRTAVDSTPIELLENRYCIGTNSIGAITVDVDAKGMTFTVVVKENGAYRKFETFNVPVKPRQTNTKTGTYAIKADTVLKSYSSDSAQELLTVESGVNVEVNAVNGVWGRIRYNGYTGWVLLNNAELVTANTTPTEPEAYAAGNVLVSGSSFDWACTLQIFKSSFGSTVYTGSSTYLYNIVMTAEYDSSKKAYKVTDINDRVEAKNNTPIPSNGLAIWLTSKYPLREGLLAALKVNNYFTFDDNLKSIYPCNPDASTELLKLIIKPEYSRYRIDEQKQLIGFRDKVNAGTVLDVFTSKNAVAERSNGARLNSSDTMGTGCKVKLYSDGKLIDTVDVIIKGDTDGDGTISSTDYLQIKRYCQHMFILSGVYGKAADTDGSGDVGLTDYLMVKRYFQGLYGLYE